MLDFFFFTKIHALFLGEIDKNLSALSCNSWIHPAVYSGIKPILHTSFQVIRSGVSVYSCKQTQSNVHGLKHNLIGEQKFTFYINYYAYSEALCKYLGQTTD